MMKVDELMLEIKQEINRSTYTMFLQSPSPWQSGKCSRESKLYWG